MEPLLVLFAVIVAASAIPTEPQRWIDVGENVDEDVEYFYHKNANFSDARVLAGQYGFAATGEGTHGGTGGAVWTVWDSWALRDAVNSNDHRIVTVRGRIDLTQLFTGSPGVRFHVGSYTSIIGGDSNAMIFGGGLLISNVRQVIVENIKIHNALTYQQGEQPDGNGGIVSMVPGDYSQIDALGIENNAHHVWINHCEFADDPWDAYSGSRRHDGLIDITRGANYISISNSLFRNHNLVSLLGNDDNMLTDRGRLKVTWYLNWFQGVTQRSPRVRFGEVHVLNNLYTDIGSYAIGVGVEAQVYAERNCFINTHSSWGWASPTGGIPNPIGFLVNFNNIFINSQFDSSIAGSGVQWRPEQYYLYGAMAAANVEAHVRRYAGTR